MWAIGPPNDVRPSRRAARKTSATELLVDAPQRAVVVASTDGTAAFTASGYRARHPQRQRDQSSAYDDREWTPYGSNGPGAVHHR